MEFNSTRDSSLRKKASEVIVQGISEEGGLFVPLSMPSLENEFEIMSKMLYNELAKHIFSLFLTDFTEEEISLCVDRAYTSEKFESTEPVKLVKLGNNESTNILELWHGPTCAFKDMALQILPHFLTTSLKKNMGGKTALILVATSGDTGKAALEGFKDVNGTEVIVFYPEDGVSPLQKKQMNTQEGKNVRVCAIEGNFDDAQTGVKHIFTDESVKKKLAEKQMFFSSANSINFGRLLPQVVYYFYSYFELYRTGEIKSFDEKINIVVPTGNFGNILASFYAYKMGLPVNKFICASNVNNVLTDFINTGVYDKNRKFLTTISPSMDILVSSNLERLLYMLSGNDDKVVKDLMTQLAETGKYEVDSKIKNEMKANFYGAYIDDLATKTIIKRTFDENQYLCDTHTAVAIGAYEKYKTETNDKTPTIIASTASPYKFVDSVLEAFDAKISTDEFENVDALEKLTGTRAQAQIKELKGKIERFDTVINRDEMMDYVVSEISEMNGDV